METKRKSQLTAAAGIVIASISLLPKQASAEDRRWAAGGTWPNTLAITAADCRVGGAYNRESCVKSLSATYKYGQAATNADVEPRTIDLHYTDTMNDVPAGDEVPLVIAFAGSKMGCMKTAKVAGVEALFLRPADGRPELRVDGDDPTTKTRRYDDKCGLCDEANRPEWLAIPYGCLETDPVEGPDKADWAWGGVRRGSDQELTLQKAFSLAFKGNAGKQVAFAFPRAHWVDFQGNFNWRYVNKTGASRHPGVPIYTPRPRTWSEAVSNHLEMTRTFPDETEGYYDVRFVEMLIEDLIDSGVRINPQKVFIAGFSGGGHFTFQLMATKSSKFQALGVIDSSLEPAVASLMSKLGAAPALQSGYAVLGLPSEQNAGSYDYIVNTYADDYFNARPLTIFIGADSESHMIGDDGESQALGRIFNFDRRIGATVAAWSVLNGLAQSEIDGVTVLDRRLFFNPDGDEIADFNTSRDDGLTGRLFMHRRLAGNPGGREIDLLSPASDKMKVIDLTVIEDSRPGDNPDNHQLYKNSTEYPLSTAEINTLLNNSCDGVMISPCRGGQHDVPSRFAGRMTTSDFDASLMIIQFFMRWAAL